MLSIGSSARCSLPSSRQPISVESHPYSTKRPTRCEDVGSPESPLLTETTLPQLRDGLIADIQGGTKEIDVLKWMGRAALELVGQGTLGYSFDPLVEDSDNDFAAAVKSFLYAAAVSFR